MKEFFKKILENIKNIYNKLSLRQKIIGAVIIVVAIMVDSM